MFAIFIILIWLGWLGVRAYLRRKDPDGLALLTGEPVEVTSSGRIRYREAPLAPQAPVEALPPAVGALKPRSAEGYAIIPGYDRRAADRRRFAERRTAAQVTVERRRGDRRSA